MIPVDDAGGLMHQDNHIETRANERFSITPDLPI
jgi:hypothetical protein